MHSETRLQIESVINDAILIDVEFTGRTPESIAEELQDHYPELADVRRDQIAEVVAEFKANGYV